MARWTEIQRTAAVLLHEQFHQLMPLARTNVFNHLFQEERKESVTPKVLKEAYDRRLVVGAAKEWRSVCDVDEPSHAEAQRRAKLRTEVTELLKDAVDVVERASHAAASTMQKHSTAHGETDGTSQTNPSQQAPITGETPSNQVVPPIVLDTSNRDQSHYTRLNMVHHRDCITGDHSYDGATGAYISPSSEVYALGGRAYRLFVTTRGIEDVMVCDCHYCAYCLTGDDSKVYSDLGKGPIPDDAKWPAGMPFVPAKDCVVNEPLGALAFDGNYENRDSKDLPTRAFTPLIYFKTSGGRQQLVRAVMCQAHHCGVCPSKPQGLKKRKRGGRTVKRYES